MGTSRTRRIRRGAARNRQSQETNSESRGEPSCGPQKRAASPSMDNEDTVVSRKQARTGTKRKQRRFANNSQDHDVIPALMDALAAFAKNNSTTAPEGEPGKTSNVEAILDNGEELGELKLQLVKKDLEALDLKYDLDRLRETFAVSDDIMKMVLKEWSRANARVKELTNKVARLEAGDVWGVADLYAAQSEKAQLDDGTGVLATDSDLEIRDLKSKNKQLESEKKEMMEKLALLKISL